MARTAARELLLTRATGCCPARQAWPPHLRGTLLPRPAASISLPLDVGKSTDTVPAWLRRAIITRDKHCVLPGCEQAPPPARSTIWSPDPAADPPAWTAAASICTFHHLIAVHRWGWQLRLNPDGTTTATLGDRTLHSHGPTAA